MNETVTAEPTFLTKAARGLVGFLRSPIGQIVVGAGMAQISGPFAAVLGKWGTEGLASALEHLTAETFTDADVEQALATKGFKVTPFDPATLMVP